MVSDPPFELLFGITVAFLLVGFFGVATPFRGEVSRLMASHIRAGTPRLLGREDAAKNSTPGNLLFVAVMGVPVCLLGIANILPRLWKLSPGAAIFASGGAVAIGAGLALLLVASARRSERPRRRTRWIGVALVGGGLVSVTSALLLL